MNSTFHKASLVSLLILVALPAVCRQTVVADSTQTNQYVIEVAGIRVGTMTANRQQRDKQTTIYTLVSDVKVNFLIYKLKIYYKVTNLVQQGKLVWSTVDAHTNRGDFSSRTEWKGDHYNISANQYKYTYRSTETRRIDYTVTDLFFSEPVNRSKAYAEYFGDYFSLASSGKGVYQAKLSDREDEYVYENGQLVKIIKKNPLKNFIIRPLKKEVTAGYSTKSQPVEPTRSQISYIISQLLEVAAASLTPKQLVSTNLLFGTILPADSAFHHHKLSNR